MRNIFCVFNVVLPQQAYLYLLTYFFVVALILLNPHAVADTPTWKPIPEGYHNAWLARGTRCDYYYQLLNTPREHLVSHQARTLAAFAGLQTSCNPRGPHPFPNLHSRYYVPNDCPVGQEENALGHCQRETCDLDSVTNESRCVAKQPALNDGRSGNNTCHPINMSNGNKFYDEVDYTGNQPQPLRLSRFYNSASAKVRWVFSYQQSLIVGASAIRATLDDGKSIIFVAENGQWVAPSHRRERLVSGPAGGYILTMPNGVDEYYSAVGQLYRINNRLVNIEQRLTYEGNAIHIDRRGQRLTLHKDVNGRVVQAILPNAVVVDYRYKNINENTSLGVALMLSEVLYDGQLLRRYHYNTTTNYRRNIVGIDNAQGERISSVRYDGVGRAISSETGPLDSGINRTEIIYHPGGTRTVKNSLGKEAIYHFTNFNGEYKLTQIEGQPSTHCAAANQAYTYDSNGFMASKTDWNGTTTTYIHNAKGQETSRTEASGTPQARTITTQWHSELNRPVVITEPERVTRFSYDTQGRLLNQVIDTRAP